MFAYYGYTISPNQLETVEGFLICRNVPIARTGEMEYLESELKPDGSSSKMVTVIRSPEEVFSEAALSSFEGKPVTDEHPPELLTPDTCTRYSKGHAQNIRRGEGEWEGHVIADLHIQDEELIRAVQDGKREISCGYECGYTENEDGTYSQHDIRGNHIAVVTRGRAGKHVAILDSKKNVNVKAIERPERNEKMKKNSLFLKLFAKAAKDASPEELETMAADAAAAMDEDPAGQEPPATPAKEEPQKEGTQDAQSLDSKMDMILDMMKKLAGGGETPAPEADPLDKLVDSLMGKEEPEGGEAKVVPAEELDKSSCAADKAVIAAVIKQLQPVIAGIKDEAAKKTVTDSLVDCLTDKEKVSDIAKIAQAAQKNAVQMTDRNTVDLDSYQAAYDAMNPHKQNGGK
ncbi:MAG: DUF2213 domain-containing protein [Clostridiaceae bacterium]|nr:DUF2213 domain-containing protein [Clostridiaceae bacterium]